MPNGFDIEQQSDSLLVMKLKPSHGRGIGPEQARMIVEDYPTFNPGFMFVPGENHLDGKARFAITLSSR